MRVQLYPFAADQAAEILQSYPKKAEVVWAQEEPRNMAHGILCAIISARSDM